MQEEEGLESVYWGPLPLLLCGSILLVLKELLIYSCKLHTKVLHLFCRKIELWREQKLWEGLVALGPSPTPCCASCLSWCSSGRSELVLKLLHPPGVVTNDSCNSRAHLYPLMTSERRGYRGSDPAPSNGSFVTKTTFLSLK